jgi:pilus assembly protein CpaE
MQTVVSCEKQSDLAPLRQMMLNCGVECSADDVVVSDDLLQRMNRGGAELLIVTLGSQSPKTLQMLRQVHEKHAVPILVLGPGNNAQLILQAMQAGARDYLDLNSEQLRQRLTEALEKLRRSGVIEMRRGHSIMVLSALPGSGVTTTASGLAFALAVRHPNRVLLAEIDAGVPELALDLDLTPRGTIGQLLRDWQRIDASAVRQAIVEHPMGVHVLADKSADASSTTAAEAGSQFVSLARTMYDYSVYDVGHGLQSELSQQTVRAADRLLVVIRLDVPSLRLTRVLLNRLADLGVANDALTLIVNRYGQSRQLDWRKAEDALGSKIDAWLPDDPATVNQALNMGQPLMQLSSWSKINRGLSKLAAQVNGQKS